MKQLTPRDTWNHKLFKDLSGRAKNITSQYGEDGLIEAIFEVCPPKNKWCVDVGASDGFSLSNTYSLIQLGWQAVLIEKIEATYKDGLLFSGYQKIVDRYRENKNVYPVHQEVVANNLDTILAEYPLPYDFDFLSLDIDSYDAEVLDGLLIYRPNLICVECDETITDLDKISYRLELAGTHNPASVGYLRQIAQQKNYDFICATVCNAFFIDRTFGKSLRL